MTYPDPHEWYRCSLCGHNVFGALECEECREFILSPDAWRLAAQALPPNPD